MKSKVIIAVLCLAFGASVHPKAKKRILRLSQSSRAAPKRRVQLRSALRGSLLSRVSPLSQSSHLSRIRRRAMISRAAPGSHLHRQRVKNPRAPELRSPRRHRQSRFPSRRAKNPYNTTSTSFRLFPTKDSICLFRRCLVTAAFLLKEF